MSRGETASRSSEEQDPEDVVYDRGEMRGREEGDNGDFSEREDETPFISQQEDEKPIKISETEEELQAIENLFVSSDAPRFSAKKGDFKRSRATLQFVNPVYELEFQREQQKFARPRLTAFAVFVIAFFLLQVFSPSNRDFLVDARRATFFIEAIYTLLAINAAVSTFIKSTPSYFLISINLVVALTGIVAQLLFVPGLLSFLGCRMVEGVNGLPVGELGLSTNSTRYTIINETQPGGPLTLRYEGLAFGSTAACYLEEPSLRSQYARTDVPVSLPFADLVQIHLINLFFISGVAHLFTCLLLFTALYFAIMSECVAIVTSLIIATGLSIPAVRAWVLFVYYASALIAMLGVFFNENRLRDFYILNKGVEKGLKAIFLARMENKKKEDKSRFIATVSHEIRTPIHGILGLAELLMGEKLSRGVRDRLVVIHECGTTLLHIVNDLLDESKLSSTGLYLSKAPFSIVELVESASRSLVVQCHSKGLEIVVHLGKTLRKYGSERQLIGDAQRINQIITNLVSNAKKFTPAGKNIYVYANLTSRYKRQEVMEKPSETVPPRHGLRAMILPRRGTKHHSPPEQSGAHITEETWQSHEHETTEESIAVADGLEHWDDEKGPTRPPAQGGPVALSSSEDTSGETYGERERRRRRRGREESSGDGMSGLTLDEAVKRGKFVETAARQTVESSSKLSDTSFQYPVELKVYVKDEGIGIDEKDHQRIFKMFEQLHTSESQKVPGTGLGLGISQKLCELMNGGIAVTSSLGKGSTFTATMVLDWAEKMREERTTAPIPSMRDEQGYVSKSSDSDFDMHGGSYPSTDDDQLASREERRGVIVSGNRYLSLVLADYLKSRGMAVNRMTHIDGDLTNLRQTLTKLAASFAAKEARGSAWSIASQPQRTATLLFDCDAFMKEQKHFGRLEQAHLQSIIQFVEDCMTESTEGEQKITSFSVEKLFMIERQSSTPTPAPNARNLDLAETSIGNLGRIALGGDDFRLNITLLSRYTTDVTPVLEKHPKVCSLAKPPTYDDIRQLAKQCGKPASQTISGDLKGMALIEADEADGSSPRTGRTRGPKGDEEGEAAEAKLQKEGRNRNAQSSLALESLDEEKTTEMLQPTIPRVLVADDDHVCRLLLSKMLKSMPELTGCSIETYTDGEDILEELSLSVDELRAHERRRRRRERARREEIEAKIPEEYQDTHKKHKHRVHPHVGTKLEGAHARVAPQRRSSSGSQNSEHITEASEEGVLQGIAVEDKNHRRNRGGKRRYGSTSSTISVDPAVTLIIVAGQMERLGGVETVRLLRTAGFRCPMVIASGSCMDSERAAFKNAGADVVVGKPFSKSTLYSTLRSVGAFGPSAKFQPLKEEASLHEISKHRRSGSKGKEDTARESVDSSRSSQASPSDVIVLPELDPVARHQAYSKARHGVFDLPTTEKAGKKTGEKDSSSLAASTGEATVQSENSESATSYGTEGETAERETGRNEERPGTAGEEEYIGDSAVRLAKEETEKRRNEREKEEKREGPKEKEKEKERGRERELQSRKGDCPSSPSGIPELALPAPSLPKETRKKDSQKSRSVESTAKPSKEVKDKEGTTKEEPKKSVLIVDDERMCLSLVSRMMKKRGLNSLVATNGKEALEILQREMPDLAFILMDCQMPEMNGYDCTEAIRQRPWRYQDAIIIGATAGGSVERCKSCGMDAILTKPFGADDVDAKVSEATNTRSKSH